MTQAFTLSIAALGKLIAGIQKHPPSGVLVIDGQSYTAAEAVALLQSIIDALSAAVSTRSAAQEASHTAEATTSANQTFVRDLKHSIQISYGQSNSVLSDFGLTPRKLGGPKTPDAKVAAAAKAKATREARHTTGPKAKLAIKGVLPAPVAVTPSAAPVIPATTPAVVPGSTGSTQGPTGH